jgi:hypothetical protein
MKRITLLILLAIASIGHAATINAGKQRTVVVTSSPAVTFTALTAVAADPAKVQVTVNSDNTVTRKVVAAASTSNQTTTVTYADPCCTSLSETIMIPAKPQIALGADSSEQ